MGFKRVGDERTKINVISLLLHDSAKSIVDFEWLHFSALVLPREKQQGL